MFKSNVVISIGDHYKHEETYVEVGGVRAAGVSNISVHDLEDTSLRQVTVTFMLPKIITPELPKKVKETS